MRKQRKILNKNTKFSLFSWLDGYLTSWKHWWIAVAVLTVVYFVHINLILPFIFAVSTVWVYISYRKYGLIDTMEFIVVLPILLFFELMKFLLGPRPGSGGLEYEAFAGEANECVKLAFNEVYEGTIVDTRTEEGRIYVTVETPYGLHVPKDEMIAYISEHLHIAPAHILFDPISDNRSYYVFGPEAVQDYEEFKRKSTRFRTFAEIKERFLCKSPVPVTS